MTNIPKQFTKNNVVINGDITEIIICNNKGKEAGRAIIDTKHLYVTIRNLKIVRGRNPCVSVKDISR